MAKITGRVYDVGLDGARGTMWLSAGFRAGTGGVVAPRRVAWPITGGDLPDNVIVEPGPAFLEIDVGVSARLEKPVVIPDEDVTLADLVSTVYDWTPQEVAEFVRLRDEAVAAAQDAAGSADAADGSATAAAGSASAAASSAGEAASSAQGAAASAQAAAGSESAAASSALAADGSAQAAAGHASDAAASAVVAADGAQVITDNLSAIEAAPGAASASAASASAAAGHAQDAAGSASSAASSASAAASSASSAADDASDAAGSASDAASSASDADQSATAAASSASDAAGSEAAAAGHASDAAADADRAEQYATEFDLTATATTGAPGTPAQVTVTGDGPAYGLSFTVPQGEKGDPGPPGEVSQAALDAAVASLVDGAPEALNTLSELATALGDDPNFATTVSTQIGQRALIDGAPAAYNTLGKLVTALQNHELGGSTDASLLTGSLTDQVDASAAMVTLIHPLTGFPIPGALNGILANALAVVGQAMDPMLADKSDVGHTHDGADITGALTDQVDASDANVVVDLSPIEGPSDLAGPLAQHLFQGYYAAALIDWLGSEVSSKSNVGHTHTADEVQGLADAINTAISAREWTGTQAQYDALGSYDPNVTYYVEE